MSRFQRVIRRGWESGRWEAQGTEGMESSIIFLRVNVWLEHMNDQVGTAQRESHIPPTVLG